jgi:hypothetical protein
MDGAGSDTGSGGIDLMERRLITFAVAVVALGRCAAGSPDHAVYETAACAAPETPLDRYVLCPQPRHESAPPVCSDAVFVRRAFLDAIGTMPTAKEARDFIESRDANKRSALVDNLLDRPEFADYWAMKWSDCLRVKAEFPINLWPNAAQAYHRWIRESIRDNKPYDRFVREMLVSNGSNFRVGPVNFYRAMQDRTPDGIARTVALTFMGERAESWPANAVEGLAVFFSRIAYKPTREWKEEIVFWDPDKDAAPAATGASVTNAPSSQATNAAVSVAGARAAHPGPLVGILPDGTRIELSADRDPREAFADWLIRPGNTRFTAPVVNRVWAWLLGRGIVHEPDDMRPDNPPSDPALLAYLRDEFVASGYDMKRLYRLILNSRTYNASSIAPSSGAARAEAPFVYYAIRRLDAEVLIDAINRIAGTSDLYTSAIPEPFTFIPENRPSISLPDGSITSPFLELFGRPARATGMDNERVNRPAPVQRMHMLNSSHIQKKLATGPGIKAITKQGRKPPAIVEDLFLAILSRFPTTDEAKCAEAYARSGAVKGREAWIDLAWALMNSDEFLYRH